MMPPFQAKATKVFMPLVVNQTLNFRPPIAFRLAGKSLHGMSSINFAVCFFLSQLRLNLIGNIATASGYAAAIFEMKKMGIQLSIKVIIEILEQFESH